LSPKTNLRSDQYGGSAIARSTVVTKIIKAVRAATSPSFCIGIKLNSVDAAASESSEDTITQIKTIVEAGIDFIEVSGGSYENPRMMGIDATEEGQESPSATSAIKPSTLQRESYFLEFAASVRSHFPNVPLMVTGGFRTRSGMLAAIASSNCDMVGMARPAAIIPDLPNSIVFNENVGDEDAKIGLKPVPKSFLQKIIQVKALGAGAETKYYAGQIRRIGNGMRPIDTRV
jgi:2,4-dienoyl-CoA reductase-like NADH-dependent reductase (Old Yellow Enzyme family)